MTVTLVVMVGVALVAGAAAWLQQRRLRPAPTVTPGAPPPSLNRADFRAPEAPLLIAVFTSSTCSSCEAVWAELSGYESPSVVTENVEATERADLHQRYKIDSVPTTVIVDGRGESQAAFVGPLGPDHRAVLADLVSLDTSSARPPVDG